MSILSTLEQTYFLLKLKYLEIQFTTKGLSEKDRDKHIEPYYQKLLDFCTKHPEYTIPNRLKNCDSITPPLAELFPEPLIFEFEHRSDWIGIVKKPPIKWHF